MSHKNYQRMAQDTLTRPPRRSSRGGTRREEQEILLEFINMQAEVEKRLADKNDGKPS
jgi:hypothetical protein